MKRSYRMVLLIAAALVLPACGENGVYTGKLITAGDHRLEAGKTERAEVIISGGQLTVEPGARLEGSLYILGGSVNVEGEIAGEASLFGGELALGPQARIDGDLNLGGGQLDPAPQAVITGKTNTGAGIRLPDVPESRRSLPQVVLQSLFLAGLAALAARIAPRPAARVAAAITGYPIVMAAMGILVGAVGLSLLVFMAYTILLIPVALLGLIVMGAAVAFGWVAFGLWVGQGLAGRLSLKVTPASAAFAGTLLFTLALELAGLIPVLRGLPGILVAVLSLGAVMLTRFGMYRFVPAFDEADSETYSMRPG